MTRASMSRRLRALEEGRRRREEEAKEAAGLARRALMSSADLRASLEARLGQGADPARYDGLTFDELHARLMRAIKAGSA